MTQTPNQIAPAKPTDAFFAVVIMIVWMLALFLALTVAIGLYLTFANPAALRESVSVAPALVAALVQ